MLNIKEWHVKLILYILHMQITLKDENEVRFKDNGVQTPRPESNENPMHILSQMMVLPQYNKPKKANNVQVMPQGELS